MGGWQQGCLLSSCSSRCSYIVPSCLGWGYFWLLPCLNPAVIIVMDYSCCLSTPTSSPPPSTLSPCLLSFSLLAFLSHSSILSSWEPPLNTSCRLHFYLYNLFLEGSSLDSEAIIRLCNISILPIQIYEYCIGSVILTWCICLTPLKVHTCMLKKEEIETESEC